MKTGRMAFALAVILGFATSCIHTRATVAPDANLAQFRTFTFLPETSQALSRTPTGAIVRDALTRELAERGIHPAPPGQAPDFVVSYQLVLREQIAASDWGWGWGGWAWGWGGWGWGGPATVYEYTEGTLVVDFVDPRTNQSFWRGTATSVVSTPDNPNPKKMEKSVAAMIDKYPIRQMAAAPGPTRM
jgi:uncharacterized protein DUF4136